MDIMLLAEARRNKISNIRDNIDAEEIVIAAEQEVLDRLEALSAQSSYSLDDVQFLIQVQNGTL